MTQKQTNSGLKNSEERLKEFENELNDYEVDTGTISIKHKSDAPRALIMTEDELKIMTKKEANICSFELNSYLAYLKKELARNNNRYLWAEHEFSKIIAQEFHKYKSEDEFIKSEVVNYRIINDNIAANNLSDMMLKFKTRANELESVIKEISNMCGCLKGLSYGY